MGLFDIFKKKKAEEVIDPEVLREQFVSARRQNLNYCQRSYVEKEQLFDLFSNTKKTELVKIGDMDATCERLLLADPCYLGSNMILPMERTSPAGKLPVFASVMNTKMTGRVIAGVKVKVSDTATVRYELAMPLGVKAWQVNDPMVYPYVDVSTGVGCVVDKETELSFAAAYNQYFNVHGKDMILDLLEPMVNETGYAMFTIPNTEVNIPLFRTGLGQGAYNAYWGFDKDNKVTELTFPFVYPELFE